MESMKLTTQLSAPLTLACAPSASQFAAVPMWAPAALARAPFAATAPTAVSVLAAERAPAPQVHQVSVQAELDVLVFTNRVEGTTSTTGFKGINVSISKRYTDGGSGVPPRGRPV